MFGNRSATGQYPFATPAAEGGLYNAGRFTYSTNQFSASVWMSGSNNGGTTPVLAAGTGSIVTASWAEVNYDSDLSASVAGNRIYKLTVTTASALTNFDMDAVRGFVPSGSGFAPANLLPQFTTFNYTAGTISLYGITSAQTGSSKIVNDLATENVLTLPVNSGRLALQNEVLALTGGTLTGSLFSPSISGTSISATTFFSGSTNLGSLIGAPTFIAPGVNAYTGGTPSRPIVGVIGSPVFTAVTASSVSGTSVSATTFFSGSTDLSTFFGQGTGTPTYVKPGVNISTGGTPSAPVINVVGSPVFTAVTATSLSGTSVSATTFYSGSTNLGS